MQEILQNLNKEQLEAVLYNDGPLLLLAGAGTGKTRVLTSKIAYIIKTNLAYPSQILAVTFTNKAANEMKNRVAILTGLDINSMWINTFHSIATRILREYGDLIGLDKNFTIIDQSEQVTIIKQIMQTLNIDHREFNPKEYVEIISKIKDKINTNIYSMYRFDEIYNLYQDKLKKSNICDFGDLLLNNIKLFTEHTEIQDLYNEKFKYILVDEYQDTNSIQHKWLQIISGVDKNKNTCITCVGDDDQSIYGWRGAEIKNILKFTKDYTKAKILKLERNYRSTQNILNIASSLISNNKNRHEKTLYSDKNTNNEKIKLIKCNDSKQEAFIIVNEIKELAKNKETNKYKNFSILVRAGYQTRIFEDIFLKYNIPYIIVGGLKFYERKEIKDCIAYLRLINNPTDDLSLERIINVPKRGIGFTTINKIKELAIENNMTMFESVKNLYYNNIIKGKVKDEIEKFVKNINEWRENSENTKLKNLMQVILTKTHFRDNFEKENTIESKNKLENIDEFLNTLDDFNNIKEFLEYVSLVNDNNEKNITDAVNIMTMHSAKGLEFDTVFLPNWQEGIFPSPKSLEIKTGLEEERRLAYVAITRAKNRLYISYSQYKYEYNEINILDISRFIKELPEEYIDFIDNSTNNDYYINYYNNKNNYKNEYFEENIINDNSIIKQNNNLIKKCIHKTFGKGYIKKEEGNKLTIVFKNYGEKTILRSFIELIN